MVAGLLSRAHFRWALDGEVLFQTDSLSCFIQSGEGVQAQCEAMGPEVGGH